MFSWLDPTDIDISVEEPMALEASCLKSNLSGTEEDLFMSTDDSWLEVPEGSDNDASLERE